MSLTIRKKGSKNFWHYFTIDGSDFEYSASDIVIIFDGNYVKLRATNGRVIGDKDGYLYSNVTLYDDTGAGTPLTYASAVLLEQALISLGYIAFYEDGDVVLSLNDLTDVEITNPTNGQVMSFESASGKWKNTALAGGGDMTKAVYDPNTVESDAFAMDNMAKPTTTETSLLDADSISFWDSVASAFKDITFTNVKAFLKTYFDTLYVAIANFLEENLVGTSIEDATWTGTENLDLSTFRGGEFTLTGNTTITVTNTPSANECFVISIGITSDTTETLTLPVAWNVYGEYVADGTRNFLTISFNNLTTAGAVVDCFISQPS